MIKYKQAHTWVRRFAIGTVGTAVLASGALLTTGNHPTATASGLAAAARSMPEITISANEYAFALPARIPAGYVSVTLVDNGTMEHQANIGRLNPGVTKAAVLAAIHKSPEALGPLVSYVGGPNTIAPGMRQRVMVDLTRGTYVALCFVQGRDGIPHVMKGQYAFFTVSAGSKGTGAPHAQGTVTMFDMGYSLPDAVASGPTVLKVVNDGPQAHEWSILRELPGHTFDDVVTFLSQRRPSGPPPFVPAGGIGALTPGTTGYVSLNLAPGQYVSVCFIPDRKTGRPHYMLGMIRAFSIH